MKVKALVFVCSIDDVERFIKKNKEDNPLFILCNPSYLIDFKKKKINFITLDKFINERIFEGQDNILYQFAQNLFGGFSEYTSYKNLNFGKLMSWELKYIFSELLFYYQQIKLILEKYKPKKVFLFLNNQKSISFFGFFGRDPLRDPLYEVLNFLQKKNYFYLEFFQGYVSLKERIKEDFFDYSLKFLNLFQKIIYKINPYTKHGDNIILSGAIKQLKSFINSSPLSKKYKFFTILDLNALEYNLSRSFFFINIHPIFKNVKNQKYFLEKYEQIINNKKFKKKFLLFEENFFELFKSRIKIIFEEILPLLSYYYEYISSFIEKINPKSICLMEDVTTFSRLLVHLANLHKIPTFVMQYGLYSDKYLTAFWPSDSKYKLLWGEKYKKIFCSLGAKKENIFIVGAPRFYNYKLVSDERKNELRQMLNIPPDKKIVLFISAYVEFTKNRLFSPGYFLLRKEYEQDLNLIISTVKDLSNMHLIIKMVPNSDNPSLIKTIIQKHNFSDVSIIHKEFKCEDLINLSDFVVTYWSTTALETLIFKKPLLTFILHGREDIVDILKYKVAYGFRTKIQLKKLLKSDLLSPSYLRAQKKYIKDHYFYPGRNEGAFETMIKIINKNF
jgi:hypothetical protein